MLVPVHPHQAQSQRMRLRERAQAEQRERHRDAGLFNELPEELRRPAEQDAMAGHDEWLPRLGNRFGRESYLPHVRQ